MMQSFLNRVSASAHELAASCAIEARHAELLGHLFGLVAAPWCGRPVGTRAPFANDLSDDASPYEFSLQMRGERADLRLLVEPQDEPYGLTGNFRAGLEANRRLSAAGYVDTGLFDEVVSLFTPRAASRGRFGLWHGIVVNPDGDVLIKAYLNPSLDGPALARVRIGEALGRGGFTGARAYLDAMAPYAQGIPYWAVDLCAAERARMKFYFAVRELGALERFVGDASAARALSGFAGPYEARPLLVCASFRQRDVAPELTVHVPVRCYAGSDREALSRVAPWSSEATRARLAASVEALDTAREGQQVVSYVSLKAGASDAFTVYLCPRLYGRAEGQLRALRATPKPATMLDVSEAIEERAKSLEKHPFVALVEGSRDVDAFRLLLQRLGFFTLVFQDVLRLALGATSDPAVRAVCEDLARGDAGHELWYLRDLHKLQVRLDLDVVFRPDYREARDLTYELLSVLAGCADDRARLSVLLVLEAAAELFFRRVPAFARRCGVSEPLEYFGEKHIQAEHAHAIHDHAGDSPLAAISVSGVIEQDIATTVARSFRVMERLARDLASFMETARAA
jgi:Tryptophan dimethylallyltransferase